MSKEAEFRAEVDRLYSRGIGWGIRITAAGAALAAVGFYLGIICTQCLADSRFTAWNWAIFVSGIGFIIVGIISIATDLRKKSR